MIDRLKLPLAVFGLACLARSALAEPFPPFDEGAANPSFAAFRAELTAIVEARDLARLEPLLDPAIRISFGADNGAAAALAEFRDDPGRWEELAAILSLGGKFETPDLFIAPYTFFAELSGDSFNTAVVIATDVNVRAGPSTATAAINALSYEAVALAPDALAAPGWVRIRLADGTLGYVSADFIRLVLDYRAGFALQDGVWRIQFFLAGD
ncbi:MAG: SH3 domain-containing protein [Bauldia sp.]|nr:SH3 domain-containing protein [Bauldia sp.]